MLQTIVGLCINQDQVRIKRELRQRNGYRSFEWNEENWPKLCNNQAKG